MHLCKQEDRINKLDRESGENKQGLKDLIGRVDTLIRVLTGVGVLLGGSVLTTLGFLITYWVKG